VIFAIHPPKDLEFILPLWPFIILVRLGSKSSKNQLAVLRGNCHRVWISVLLNALSTGEILIKKIPYKVIGSVLRTQNSNF
jgi:hypothetical protein